MYIVYILDEFMLFYILKLSIEIKKYIKMKS